MKHVNIVRTVITVTASLFLAVQARAEIHSRTNELIVVQPKDLPEQAQMPGNSFFLYSDSAGFTYLYVEQQQGAQLTVFDVTNPSKIKGDVNGRLNGGVLAHRFSRADAPTENPWPQCRPAS